MAHHATHNGTTTILRPVQYLEAGLDGSIVEVKDRNDVALVILNSPLDDYEYVKRLYDHATFRLCADGGANRLYDVIIRRHGETGSTEALRAMIPDLIHGDLDSLKDDVRKLYAELGVQTTHDADQYSTDFGKAIVKVIEQLPQVQDVLVLGSLGGRVDQGIGLLHELYREQILRHPGVRFWLFSESSVSVILRRGSTIIQTPLKTGLIKRNIGILPMYGPGIITTQGLEWDVSGWPTEMGGQVSTSNHVVADQITVTTDREVLFTVERRTIG